MKKIIFLVSCILNLVGMQSPKPNFTEEEINLRLRFSPFERAVLAILQNDHDSLNTLIDRNPKLLELKSPTSSNARLLDIAKTFKRDTIARSLSITDDQEVKRDSPIKSLSALHIAAEFDDEELAKFLLNNGECPETIDENGIRPISVARNKDNAVHKIYKNYLDGYIADDEK